MGFMTQSLVDFDGIGMQDAKIEWNINVQDIFEVWITF